MAYKKKIRRSNVSGVNEKKNLFIGIDLGTNHTAISTSDGKKNSILSIVGAPKDAVASKFLKKEHLFGEEALKHRDALKLYRPIERGVLKIQRKSIEAAKGLVEFVLRSVNADRDVRKYAIIGVPAQASVQNKKIIPEMAKDFFDGIMVASEPLCVAYNLGKFEHSLIVDIGAATTDLCRVHGARPNPEDQISSTKAGDFIDREFVKLVTKNHTKLRVTREMARLWKEKYSFVGNPDEEIIVEVPRAASVLKLSITQEMRRACESILPDIVSGISRLISTYDPEFQDELRSNLYIAGGGSQIRNLDTVLEHELELIGGCKVLKTRDPVFGGAAGALKMAIDMPKEFWQTT